MRLSTHFTLAEAEFSDTARRLGLNNSLPEELIPASKQLAEKILEPVRAKFGRPFSPTSWYRGPELNKAVRGAATSQHCKGEAVDIKIPGISNMDIAVFIRDNLEFDQLILEFWDGKNPNTGWVHVSLKASGANRKQVLNYNGKSYQTGLPNV